MPSQPVFALSLVIRSQQGSRSAHVGTAGPTGKSVQLLEQLFCTHGSKVFWMHVSHGVSATQELHGSDASAAHDTRFLQAPPLKFAP